MNIKIIGTEKLNRENNKELFPSLYCAIQWAKQKQLEELQLIKVVIKEVR